MIETIRIKNIALIEEAEVSFSSGLNIMSGETGAGKSIIIGSIAFLLGQKPTADFVRTDCELAEVEGLFRVENEIVADAMNELGLSIDEDNLLVIYRTLTKKGKTNCRINGRPVTISMLKEISKLLIDVHGQHEHQSLLNTNKHIELLDRFATDELAPLKEELAAVFKDYKNTQKNLEALMTDEREKVGLTDLLSFQLEEISAAGLREGEEDELNQKRKILANSEKLAANAKEFISLLDEGDLSASDNISKAVNLLGEIEKMDPTQTKLYESLLGIEAELSDIVREMRRYDDNLYFDPAELNETEERLNTIYNLKRKYGNSIEEILAFKDEAEKKLNLITNSDEEIKKLEKLQIDLEKQALKLCNKISKIRKKKAAMLEKGILNNLTELGMADAQFKIDIESLEKFTQNGFDKAEFLISPNLGEPLKSLNKIASGGEMSRVMLALKNVLSEVDSIDTFIFDEIDAGISGRTAQKVAEKMKILSESRQIICITHLPQIASMAERHFLIEKEVSGNKTLTKLSELKKDESVKELARLIGGAEITEQTLTAAAEMKELAGNIKKVV